MQRCYGGKLAGSSNIGKGLQTLNALPAWKCGFVSEQIRAYFKTESENQKSEMSNHLHIHVKGLA